MRTFTLLAIVLIVGAALAGCAKNEATTSPTTTPTASTPTPTPTPTATPTIPTVVTPSVPTVVPSPPATPVTNATNATVTKVYVVSLNEKAANGTSAPICWRVEGTGTISHTAVHWGVASSPNGSFSAYPNAVYPNNGPAVGTHKLPSTFCATVGPINATTYLKAHAMVDPTQSQLSTEETIVAGSGNNTIDTVGAPEVVPARFTYNFCWELPGVTNVSTHTAIHYGSESRPNGTFSDYAEAVYPDNGPATLAGSFALPGPFCANVAMPSNGTLYMRAHALVNGTSFLGPERSVVVGPRVDVTGGLPATAAAGSIVNLCWRVEGSTGVSAHTAIHHDTTSHPNATAVSDYPEAIYPDNGPATTTGNFTLPGPFCANLTMPASGAVYFRPHAIYPAPGNAELGPEYSIRVA